MERVNFFSGMEVTQKDFSDMSSIFISQMKDRTVDFFSKGVIGTNATPFVITDLNNTIKVLPFVAYTPEGERIYVYKEIRALALDLSDPEERRLCQRGSLAQEDFGWEVNTDYDIYVAYIEVPASPRAHVKTGEFYPTRVNSGFEFYAFRVGVDPVINKYGSVDMVRLCRLRYNGETIEITTSGYLDVSTVDASKVFTRQTAVKPATYNPNFPVSIEDHIKCVGSGTPTPNNPHGYTPEDLGFDGTSVPQHEAVMHASGIIGDRASLTSCLYTGLNYISNDNDNIILYNLYGNERLQYKGIWLSSLSETSLSRVFLNFKDGYAPRYNTLPKGAYKIGVVPGDGTIVIGSDDVADGREIIVSEDSACSVELFRKKIVSLVDYSKYNAFDLAEFTFSPEKETSYIVSSITNSNFITKTDLRKFGTVSPDQLITTKTGSVDDLVLPYRVKVQSLQLADGYIVTSQARLPKNYIDGFSIIYNSANVITVAPGVAKDATNVSDIVLSASLTKNISVPWAPGGYTTPVGGLQNSPASPALNTSGGYGLYVFVIMDSDGNVDVALDTNIQGANILNPASPTSAYKYIRRIGALYISHLYSTSGAPLYPFTSVVSRSGLWIFYSSSLLLTESMYSDGAFTLSYIPPGTNFLGKFTYKISGDTVVSIKPPLIPLNELWISGAGAVEFHVPNQKFSVSPSWSFSNSLSCLGYLDSRS